MPLPIIASTSLPIVLPDDTSYATVVVDFSVPSQITRITHQRFVQPSLVVAKAIMVPSFSFDMLHSGSSKYLLTDLEIELQLLETLKLDVPVELELKLLENLKLDVPLVLKSPLISFGETDGLFLVAELPLLTNELTDVRAKLLPIPRSLYRKIYDKCSNGTSMANVE
ncbi:hypothetical protein BCR33DRAFT_784517 [Rhizoclosmatium globosum]|uniref:Uncharacterized protein n=1 Tax=Rhizoclosmatium globosum TaxID=329046 RepID=A0A1Y2CDF2_9FUNG|nr:hypothetical protein BCR33DRAFT_784517 [Rhizoclosmatium globosum]|eukprot:ORY45069.1 hypothetical protein BCR33DRAFT_784517 [Rhizoclosmatium globosum]